MTVIRMDTIEREDCKNCDILNILIELDNQTAFSWESGEFDVEFKSLNGDLLNIEKQGIFQFKLHPNSKARVSIKVPIYKEYSNSEVHVKLNYLRQQNWY